MGKLTLTNTKTVKKKQSLIMNKKILFLLMFILVFFSCTTNDNYIVIKPILEIVYDTNGNVEYLKAYCGEEFCCEYFYYPKFPKKSDDVFVTISNENILELVNISEKNCTITIKAIDKGESKIRIQSNDNHYSTSNTIKVF